MDWKHRIRTELAGAGHSPDDEVVEELALHARALYDTARAEGASPAEAGERVARQIALWAGEAPGLQRRPRRAPVVEPPASATSRLVGVAHDLKYAVRLLRRRPGATLVSMLTMALGIGATTVLFSVAWGVLGKALPWPDADRLVRLAETRQGSTRRLPPILTNGTYLAWRDARGTIDEIGGWSGSTVTVTDRGDPQRIRIGAVTPSDVLAAWREARDRRPVHHRHGGIGDRPVARALAAALRRQSWRARRDAEDRRRAADGRRRDAARLHVPRSRGTGVGAAPRASGPRGESGNALHLAVQRHRAARSRASRRRRPPPKAARAAAARRIRG